MLARFQIEERRRVEFLGCPIDLYDMSETVGLIGAAIASRRRLQHVVVNVAKLVSMRRNPTLRRDVSESDLINIDGMGVVWGCQLLGLPVRERVAGIDLMLAVLHMCEERGHKPFFLGAEQPVLDAFVSNIKERFPGLEIAGWRNGYFDRQDEHGIARQIRWSGADCLFVAISSPVKERFLNTYRDRLDVPFLMGVGGSIDVLSGHVARAPAWMQRAGLEWFFRMLQEPHRLARRYLVSNTKYAALLARALCARVLLPAQKRQEQEESIK